MIKLLRDILFDEVGGLGILQGSIVSMVADMTGDDSADAAVKIKRLINERGHDFCNLTNWKFLRSDISFNIGTSKFKYSGSDILPATFKNVLKSYLLDGTTRHPLTEVPVQRAYEWTNPNENSGLPHEFVVTRPESDFWEIQFRRLPDKTYTVFMEIELQWVDVTSSVETLITKQFSGAFAHFVSMARLRQQGDTESLIMMKQEWHDLSNPGMGILDRALSVNRGPLRKKGVRVLRGFADNHAQHGPYEDYQHQGHFSDNHLDGHFHDRFDFTGDIW